MDNKLNMESPSSLVPAKWQERFLIKRYNELDIEVSLELRNGLVKAINNGARFVQVMKHTIAANSIKSIDPKYGEDNIPPRPNACFILDEVKQIASRDDSEGKEWDKVFYDKQSSGVSYQLLSSEK